MSRNVADVGRPLLRCRDVRDEVAAIARYVQYLRLARNESLEVTSYLAPEESLAVCLLVGEAMLVDAVDL
jgi:hypothetical protein